MACFSHCCSLSIVGGLPSGLQDADSCAVSSAPYHLPIGLLSRVSYVIIIIIVVGALGVGSDISLVLPLQIGRMAD